MADKWCSLCGKHTDHRSGYHARQPCRTCRNYTEGKPCPTGGDVLPWWTGCIVWEAGTDTDYPDLGVVKISM